MQTQTTGASTYTISDGELTDARSSAVAWGAIFAGAAAAAALSLILLILGVGLGLSVISPWSNDTDASEIGTSTFVWIAFVQLAASGLGGYIAGRLRTRWASVHGDEVFFRDTAHGFLAWAVATLFTAAVLTSSITTIVGGAANVTATATAPAVAAASGQAASKVSGAALGNPTDYFVDMLLRSDQSAADVHDEVGRILTTDLEAGKLSPEDRTYLASLVARRTNISQGEAEARVDTIFARATQAINDAKKVADEAREAAAHAALWMFVALLIGAFIASFAATFGGRLRDDINTHKHNHATTSSTTNRV